MVLHYPHPGFVEIDPDELWTSVVSVVQKSLRGELNLNYFKIMLVSNLNIFTIPETKTAVVENDK